MTVDAAGTLVGTVALAPDSPAIGPRTIASLIVHSAKLVLKYADLDSCAMHGCGTAATWESTDDGRHREQLPRSHAGLGCGPTLDNAAAQLGAGVAGAGSYRSAGPAVRDGGLGGRRRR